jgi:hypothetical protein
LSVARAGNKEDVRREGGEVVVEETEAGMDAVPHVPPQM